MAAGDILLLTTGGTIGSEASSDGFAPTTGSGRALAQQLNSEGVVLEELFAEPSGGIGLDRMAVIHERIETATCEGYSAVVVTHGTDTLAETAFVLRLLRGESKFPVVLTGAMRSPGLLGSDGLRNLTDAATVARSGRDFGTGVLVVFDGDILSALRAAKTSSTAISAFGQSTGGPLGLVSENCVRVHAREVFRGLPIPVDARKTESVALVGAWPGDDGRALIASAKEAAGLVVSGLGGGHIPPQMMDAVTEVVSSRPVIVTTGTPCGPALRATYGGAGSERALANIGAIVGWSLGPRKAALALSMCLGQTKDGDTLRSLLQDDMEGAQS